MRILYIFIFLVFISNLFAQKDYPSNYFRSPLLPGATISSNFGEIRPSHFHAGFDYSAKSGTDIFSVADGYVSRVKVSSTGYGNAIYITHPNGFVSVYAHLSAFYPAISQYVYQTQHNVQQFEIDNYLYPGEFAVKKGQVIGKVGNTGRSFGAHLHFEIRDAVTEEIINPFLFGFDIPDNEAPKIEGVYLYRFDQGRENYKYVSNQLLDIKENDTISTFGTVGFGAEIHDYLQKKKKERYGVYEIILLVDDRIYFHSQMEKVSFDESKYLNSFTDYDLYREKGLKISKCFIEPNNKLRVYKSEGNGLINFSDTLVHKVKIFGNDISGNSTEINFFIRCDSSAIKDIPYIIESEKKEIDCTKPYEFATNSFKISFSENALYYNIDFKYSNSKIGKNNYSEYHHIHNHYVPIHDAPIISIKALSLPEHLKSKALIAGIGLNRQQFSLVGVWNDDFIVTPINSFGTYYITVDTIAPTILKYEPKKKKRGYRNKNIKQDWLRFEIDDNLSGISDYVAYIDNQWVLFEYDEKYKLLTCYLPSENIKQGEHNLVLWVRDMAGNIGTYESKFKY